MPTRIFGPSTGNRRPTQVAPSKTPAKRPTAQRGGGGNKAAGSVEPTAATTPTVTVSPTGTVTPEHFGPSPQQQRQAQRATREARESRQRVQRVRNYVRQRDQELTPKREVHVSKEFLARQQSPKPVTVKAYERPHPTKPRQSVPVAEHQRALPTRQEKQQARQAVRQAKKVVQKTTGLTGPITHDQKVFAQQVAKETGLSPRVVAAQALAEESGSAATQREAEGNNDWLNIGYYDSGPGAITKTPEWRDPHSAARATSEFFKGRKFGPSSSIANIVPSSAGRSDQAQIEAIGNSNWATSGAYRESIEGTHQLIGEKRNPQAVKNLKAAVKEARELGLKVSPTGIQAPGPPPKKLVKRTTAAEVAMKEVDGLPYVWGGGHGAPNSEPTGGGLDCSGAVGYVLNKIGALHGSLTSGEMGSVLKPGPGALTVYYNPEHTFLSYVNKKGETIYWGTSVGDSGAGGLGTHPTPSSEYLAQYNVGHVPGMGRKQALQLGAAPGSFTSAGTAGTFSSQPGMTFSEGGTTATIEQGHGTKVEGKPGFSKKPIELTYMQKVRRNVNLLKSLGTEVAGPGEETRGEAANKPGDASLKAQLAALQKKYSIGAV